MRKLLIFLFAMPLAAQTINPNQIKPSTHNGYVLTTETGATVWAPSAGGAGYAVKHNGTLLTGQFANFTDFDDTTPAAPANSVNVTFQTNVGTGKLSAYVPAPSNFIQPQLIPPTAGQYVVLHPTSNTPFFTGNCNPPAGFPPISYDNNSALLYLAAQVSGFPPSTCQVTWDFNGSLAAQAPWVVPGNITGIYATAVSSYFDAVGSNLLFTGPSTLSFIPTGIPAGFSYALQQSTSTLTAYTGATIDTAFITAELSRSGTSSESVSIYTVNSPSLFVFYTGTAPPNDGSVKLAPPFTLTVDSNGSQVMGIDPNFPRFLIPQPLVQAIAKYPAGGQLGFVMAINDGASASDCTVGGGSSPVLCQSNGTVYVAVGGGGGSGTVTSVATTTPIAGGPITTTGTITCPTCVVASSPGVGLAHFAGSTQTVTSSAVNLAGADVTGLLPHANIAATAVTPGSYTNANVTVAADGSITAAANGSTSGVATVTATSPITVNGGAGPASGAVTIDCPTCSVGSGTSVKVNGGSILGTANLSDTTPAAGTNGKNVAFQNSGSDVSAEIVGDGNSSHFLNGIGTYTAPGAGGLPTATQPGQMIASTAAGTTYAVTPQVFYNQTTDTITTIENECSSPCTYYVTQNMTLTLGASHAMNSNVTFVGLGGKMTINGAFTLSNVQVGSATKLTQLFAGTSTVTLALNVPLAAAEWFGAVGYSSQASAAAGTDSTTALNTCIAAVTGQCLLQAMFYRTTAVLTVSKSNTGLAGTVDSADAYAGTGNPSAIVQTTAGANIVDANATSLSYYYGIKFSDIELRRNVTPTGTATGFNLSFLAGMSMNHVTSADSIKCFSLKSMPFFQTGGITNSVAKFGYDGVSDTGTIYGWFLDGSTGFLSLRMNLVSSHNDSGQGTTSYGFYFSGGPVDLMIDGMEATGGNYGIFGTAGARDTHIHNFIIDGVTTRGIYWDAGVTTLEFSGGWINTTSAAAYGVEFNGSGGVLFNAVTMYQAGRTAQVLLTNASVGLSNNLFYNNVNAVNGVTISGGTQNVLTSNLVVTGNNAIGWNFVNTTKNTFQGNITTQGVTSSTCAKFDASSSNNTFAQLNTCTNSSTVLNDAGTANQLVSGVSPLTTKGDVWGYSTANARVPVGANGTVLTADSTQALGVKWASTGTATVICSGSQALGTTAIGSGAAATTITTTCTGLLTTDNIQLDFNADPTATTGYIPSASGMLTIIKWPTANTINISVVNNTASSITPGAVTVNYRVVR